MKTTLRDVLKSCHERSIFLSVDGPDLVLNGPVGKLTHALREGLLEWKKELLLMFASHPREDIPESFFKSPCYRCGLYADVCKTESGIWVCKCYYDIKYGLNPSHWRKPQQGELREHSA